jgi:hypothetical protein
MQQQEEGTHCFPVLQIRCQNCVHYNGKKFDLGLNWESVFL